MNELNLEEINSELISSGKKNISTKQYNKKFSPFITDFPSPADEIKRKAISKEELQKTNKIDGQFYCSSENWFG